MNLAPSWLSFVIYALAVFRLSILFGEDSGPWKLFARLRSRVRKESKENTALRKSDLQKGIGCLKCESVWWAAAIAAYAFFRDKLIDVAAMAGDAALYWMALSGLAIIINRQWPSK